MRTRRTLVAALLAVAAADVPRAQAPDGNAILRAAGVAVPRGGAEAAFTARLAAPSPVPPGAFATLIVGMGPVGARARIRNAYAFGVLAGRSARPVPPGELAGAGVALLQMIVEQDRATRVAATRVAGRVFAAPLDGKPAPPRPTGLVEAILQRLATPNAAEQAAAMEAIGLLRETAAVPALTELYWAYRERANWRMAGAALDALARIGDPRTRTLAQGLGGDAWGDRDDALGLTVAFARERFLEDGSVKRLQAAAAHRTLGPVAREYLAELGRPLP